MLTVITVLIPFSLLLEHVNMKWKTTIQRISIMLLSHSAGLFSHSHAVSIFGSLPLGCYVQVV